MWQTRHSETKSLKALFVLKQEQKKVRICCVRNNALERANQLLNPEY
jgi:hypothetical protein